MNFRSDGISLFSIMYLSAPAVSASRCTFLPSALFGTFLCLPLGRLVGRTSAVELSDEVGAPYASQFVLYVATLLRFVPEEEHALCLFLARRFGAEHWFERVRIVAGVPCFSADGHRGGGEILYLFQMEVESFGYHGEFGHIFFAASRMAAYEVRYDLLVESFFAVYAVERLFELFEQGERRFAHVLQYVVACVLRRYLQSSAHVVAYQFSRILTCGLVGLLVLALVQQQVVAHSSAYEALL